MAESLIGHGRQAELSLPLRRQAAARLYRASRDRRRAGGRQQGLEPDAHGAGRPARAAGFRAAHRLVPAPNRHEAGLRQALASGIAGLEAATGMRFGAHA